MSQRTRNEVAELIRQADEICRQAQDLQKRLTAAMKERAPALQSAKSTPGRRKTTRKK